MSQQSRIPYFQKINLDLLPGYLGKAFDQLISFWNDHDTGTKQWTVVNTASLTVVGVTDGSSAVAGNVGETMRSFVASSSVSAAATGTYVTITSLPLTKGDWDVSAAGALNPSGCTFSTQSWGVVLSKFSGATTTDHVEGDNLWYFDHASANAQSGTLPTTQFNLSANTTVYLKCTANYSAGTPLFYGSIFARRAH